MLGRCRCKSTGGYKNYGGRGIKVCERWEKFENFLADMGPRPEDHSIDRINNDGNYEPSNCRWASRELQSYNKTGFAITHGGQTMFAHQWAAKLGISKSALHGRLRTMPIDRALSSWIGHKSRLMTHEQATARANWDRIASQLAPKGMTILEKALLLGEAFRRLATELTNDRRTTT